MNVKEGLSMLNYKEIDFDEVWFETMGWNSFCQEGRKFFDEYEADFWKKLAPRYTTEYNLNNDTHKIAQKLAELLGENQNILEIGCGTGNFTMLMAEYSKHILGVDFSQDMLNELNKRVISKKYQHIDLVQNKWEDYLPESKFDYIVSVNSLYCIRYMKEALVKMHETTTKGVVLVRTIQEPFLAKLYEDCNLQYNKCLDYELIPIILWRMGILAQVEFIHYTRQKTYNSLAEIEQDILKDLSSTNKYHYDNDFIFRINKDKLQQKLQKYLKIIDDKYVITMPRVTAFIYWKK